MRQRRPIAARPVHQRIGVATKDGPSPRKQRRCGVRTVSLMCSSSASFATAVHQPMLRRSTPIELTWRQHWSATGSATGRDIEPTRRATSTARSLDEAAPVCDAWRGWLREVLDRSWNRACAAGVARVFFLFARGGSASSSQSAKHRVAANTVTGCQPDRKRALTTPGVTTSVTRTVELSDLVENVSHSLRKRHANRRKRHAKARRLTRADTNVTHPARSVSARRW